MLSQLTNELPDWVCGGGNGGGAEENSRIVPSMPSVDAATAGQVVLPGFTRIARARIVPGAVVGEGVGKHAQSAGQVKQSSPKSHVPFGHVPPGVNVGGGGVTDGVPGPGVTVGVTVGPPGVIVGPGV